MGDNELMTNLATVEIKKELSDEDGTIPYEFETDDDCMTSNDAIFEVIPFMAKLLSNLKCSFYSRNSEIVIAGVELTSVQELIDRLVRKKIIPNRMDCGIDSTFTLFICDEQFNKISQYANENSLIIRFLPHMAVVTECTNLSLRIENSEIQICSISYDSLASLMIRLKEYDIRPKRVDSLRNSLFSLIFTDQSFSNDSNILKVFQNEANLIHDPLNIRRPRICPNYLRDYVIENNNDEPVSGLDLISFVPSRSNLAPVKTTQNHSNNESLEDLGEISPLVKRGRGRPRIKPRASDFSLDSNQIKRARGRPRRSDIVPSIVAPRSNSFINIQPKSMTVQELESCFVKFLEAENLCNQK